MAYKQLCDDMAKAASEQARLDPSAWRARTASAMDTMLTRSGMMTHKIHAIQAGGTSHNLSDFRDKTTVFEDLDRNLSDDDHLRAMRPALTRLCSEVGTDTSVEWTLGGRLLHTPSWLFIVSIIRSHGNAAAASCAVETFWVGYHDPCSIKEELLEAVKEQEPAQTADDIIHFIRTLAMSRQVATISQGRTTRLAPFAAVSEPFRLQLLSFVTGIQKPTVVARLAGDVVAVIEGDDQFPVLDARSRVRMVKWSTDAAGTNAETKVLPAFISADGLREFADAMTDIFHFATARPNTADLVRYLVQDKIHQVAVIHFWERGATDWLRQSSERLAQFTKAVARLVYPGQNVSPWNQSTPGTVRCGRGDQWWQVAVTLYDYAVTVRPSARPGSAFLDVGDAEDAASETRVARSHRRVFDRRALEAAMRGLMDAVDAGGY